MLLLSNKQVNLYMWEQAINLAVEEINFNVSLLYSQVLFLWYGDD